MASISTEIHCSPVKCLHSGHLSLRRRWVQLYPARVCSVSLPSAQRQATANAPGETFLKPVAQGCGPRKLEISADCTHTFILCLQRAAVLLFPHGSFSGAMYILFELLKPLVLVVGTLSKVESTNLCGERSYRGGTNRPGSPNLGTGFVLSYKTPETSDQKGV